MQVQGISTNHTHAHAGFNNADSNLSSVGFLLKWNVTLKKMAATDISIIK